VRACVHACMYLGHYPSLNIAQSALPFTHWQICSTKHDLDFSGKNPTTLQLVHKYPPTIFCKQVLVHTAELKQSRVEKPAQGRISFQARTLFAFVESPMLSPLRPSATAP